MKLKSNKVLSLLLAAALLMTLLPISTLAADYDGHWAREYIDEARNRGWMNGFPDGTFRPDESITRAEFSVMLWRAMGEPEPTVSSSFSDAAAGDWYYDAVMSLYEAGIVNGYGDGAFGPNETVTREMAFVMLARALGLAPENAGSAAEYTKFDDYADVSPWATDAVSIMIEKGYVSGVEGNQLAPKRVLTRGEMSKLLIVVFDGEQGGDEPVIPLDDTGPVLTLSYTPTADTSDPVTITVDAKDESGIDYIGWRASSSGAAYTDDSGFTGITGTGKFSVSANGWYAVCAVDGAGNFAYKLIQITNIQASSGSGGLSGGGGGGGGDTSTTYYTVTYNSNGGDTVNSQRIAEGGKATRPADPTKAGSTFAGWYKDTSLTTAWDFANDTVNSDITLYAKWTIITYTVTYSANGGTGSDYKVSSIPGGDTCTVLGNDTTNFSKTDYNFVKWNTASDGGGVSYYPGDTFTVTGDITLFAIYTDTPSVDFMFILEVEADHNAASSSLITNYIMANVILSNGTEKIVDIAIEQRDGVWYLTDSTLQLADVAGTNNIFARAYLIGKMFGYRVTSDGDYVIGTGKEDTSKGLNTTNTGTSTLNGGTATYAIAANQTSIGAISDKFAGPSTTLAFVKRVGSYYILRSSYVGYSNFPTIEQDNTWVVYAYSGSDIVMAVVLRAETAPSEALYAVYAGYAGYNGEYNHKLAIYGETIVVVGADRYSELYSGDIIVCTINNSNGVYTLSTSGFTVKQGYVMSVFNTLISIDLDGDGDADEAWVYANEFYAYDEEYDYAAVTPSAGDYINYVVDDNAGEIIIAVVPDMSVA